MKNVTLVLLLATIVGVRTTSADDWPQWLGTNRDGVSTETSGEPLTQMPQPVWKTSIGVGVSSVGLEMQYVTPIPGLAPSIGKSSQSGAQASIGGKANCLRPISPFPAQAKFIVTAKAGAGVVAAQLFSK